MLFLIFHMITHFPFYFECASETSDDSICTLVCTYARPCNADSGFASGILAYGFGSTGHKNI